MKKIPFHQLQERTSTGLEIEHFMPGESQPDEADTIGAHRDDHYIFFVLEKGEASIMIDFSDVCMQHGMLYYVLPAQVHRPISNQNAQGWFVAVDATLIPTACRDVFEGSLQLQLPYTLTSAEASQFSTLLRLLIEKYAETKNDIFYLQVVHALVLAFTNLAASCYTGTANKEVMLTRPMEICRQFKKLLKAPIRDTKSPAAFAEKLHVSPSYLSEAVKMVTGFAAGYWIEQEVLIEAKRLLYYTNLTVKETAHALGYADHAYFGRFFRKAAGITPLAFRAQYRK